jgi:hypothetical protein
MGKQEATMRLVRLFALSNCGLLVLVAAMASPGRLLSSPDGPSRNSRVIVVTPQPAAATLADFAWLAGRWEGKLGPTAEKQLTAEQQWMPPKNDTMLGFFRLTDNEKTVVIELFTIRETTDGIVFYFRHFSPELKPWEEAEAYHLNLTKSDGTTFRFDNPVVNQLKDAILTHTEADTYISHGDITGADGKPAAIEVTYHRVK